MKAEEKSRFIAWCIVSVLTCSAIILRCIQFDIWNHEKVYAIGMILVALCIFLFSLYESETFQCSLQDIVLFFIFMTIAVGIGMVVSYTGFYEWVPVFLPTVFAAAMYGVSAGFCFHIFYVTDLYILSSYENEGYASDLYIRWLILGILLVIGIKYFSNYAKIAYAVLTVVFFSIIVNIFYFNLHYEQIKYDLIIQNTISVAVCLLGGFFAVIFKKLFVKVPDDNTWVENVCSERFPPIREYKETAQLSYQHALQVQKLALLAAKRIGANEGIVRAGALYHEIGKSVSKDYVRTGVSICTQYDLPECVVDIVIEHGLKIRNPRTIESAIVMLADSVINSIQYVKSQKQVMSSRKIIENVLEVRFDSGALGECPMTIKQYQDIREVFLHAYEEES